MALFSVAIQQTTPTNICSVPPGARKIIISNPTANAQIVALKLDCSATALTFANGIQLVAGAAPLIIDLDIRECPLTLSAISATSAAVLNAQTLGTGV